MPAKQANASVSRETHDQYELRVREFFNVCTAERNRFIQAKAEEAKAYDRTILTISAGAIGLSLTFIEKIVPTPTFPNILFISWSCFGLAILSVVISFIVSQLAIEREIAWIDASWDVVNAGGTDLPARTSNRQLTIARLVNVASGALFVAGIGALIVFSMKNWPRPTPSPAVSTQNTDIRTRGELMPKDDQTGKNRDIQGNTPIRAVLPSPPQKPAAPASKPTSVPSPPTSSQNRRALHSTSV